MKIKPIRSAADLAHAKAEVEELLLRGRSTEEDDRVEILASLIDHYERSAVRTEAPSPVAAIRFRMEELGMNARQLEPFIGSRSRVHEILNGTRSLSIDMIRSLHEGLGIPYAALIQERIRPQSETLRVSSSAIDRLREFGFELRHDELPLFVQSTFRTERNLALHKKTLTQRAASKTDFDALVVWQAAVLRRSSEITLPVKYQPAALTPEVMRKVARYSSQPGGPRKATAALNSMGIAVVFLGALPGTFLDGAAMVASDDTPIVALTLRHDRIDSFWFTLLHELSHLRLHYERLVTDISAFVDDLETRAEDRLEREADELARESLIPSQFIAGVRWNEMTTLSDLQAVASRARVHLSIAAGRWQRDHQNYRRFSRLIERDAVRSMFNE